MNPRYRWLTHSFVEALELREQPVQLPRRGSYITLAQSNWLAASPSPYRRGVLFEGRFYEREPDGLAWALIP